ncbi:MAG: vWA domain-containing protein, partial [Alphaproteobacteria bacterium]
EANMVFKANFPNGYMEATVTGPVITIANISTGNDLITVSGAATVPTYFVRLIGIDSFTVRANTEVTRRTVYMDVVVSIDVSGSMDDSINGVKKIDAARTAANVLVDALFGTADTKELLKMGFVTWNANARILPIGYTYVRSEATSQTVPTFKNPYNGTANINTIWKAKDSPVPLLSRPPNGWTGCVEARFTNDSTANDADTVIDYPIVNSRNWKVFRPATTNSSGDAMQCTNQGIQRLTNTKATIKSAIASATSPSGNTNLVAGLSWGWSLLGKIGPFAGDETPPPAPDEGELVRALILMTDGDNTQSSTDAYRGALNASGLDARTRLAAQAVKDAGIIIYAIRFGAASGSEALLKEVASGPTAPYYQYAPDAASLQAAFQEIGNHLSKLRLSR